MVQSARLPFPAVTFSEPLCLSEIQQALHFSGACLLHQLPIEGDHASLLQLAFALGQPIYEPRNIEGQFICAVEVERRADFPAYANTPYAFDLHTDCSDLPEPPDLVLLHCEQAAEQGGESTFLQLNVLLEALSAEDIAALQEPVFAFRDHVGPILTFVAEGGHFEIRYNRLYPELQRRLAERSPGPQEALLDRLDAAASRLQSVFQLQKGDCWITQNRTTLHGRRAFNTDSTRRLKRVRLNLA